MIQIVVVESRRSQNFAKVDQRPRVDFVAIDSQTTSPIALKFQMAKLAVQRHH
jgi:hypothetical protein